MASQWLEIGIRDELLVRQERITDRHDSCQLLYVSDLHLRRGRSRLLNQQVVAAVQSCQPDAVLLGGDLVDGAGELLLLTELTRSLKQLAPVFAVGGNHDAAVGLDRVASAVEAGDGQWIHRTSVTVRHSTRMIAICGPEVLEKPLADFNVMCGHHPWIWRRARRQGFDLVLAGHLHGCQAVALEFRSYLFPGAMFYPYCCLRTHFGSATLVVSRGVSDLVPVRWRCPREVVLCEI